MKLFPFILRSVHLAHLALKDEHIASLRSELSVARTDRLRAEAARDAAVTKAFDLLTPKPAEAAKTEVRPRREKAATPARDLSQIDPNDQEAIRDIALSEMSPGKTNATFLTQKMASIKAQIHQARAAKHVRATEVGPPPENIAAMIDNAISDGKERAGVN